MGLDISAICISDTVREEIAPRGQEKFQSLTKCVRYPGIANTAEEELTMLRTWRTAQKRGQDVGTTALGGNERFTVLVKMISKLQKKHSQL
eukprot:5776143-Prorocentrum_lima.AAC.1